MKLLKGLRNFNFKKMEKEENLHILFSCQDTCPAILLDKLTESIKTDGLEFKILKRPLTFYAAFEWAIPTAFFVIITKSYFDSFLKEAGKDHYIILKKWIKDLITKCRDIKITTIVSEQTPEKIEKKYTQSKVISIIVELDDNRILKLFFDESINIEVWMMNIDKILNSIFELYEKLPNDKLSSLILNLGYDERYSTIFAIIDKETNEWKFSDNWRIFG